MKIVSRPKVFLWFLIYLLALPLLYGQVKTLFAAVEPEAAGTWGDPHVGVVADTTASMGPALNVLANAWSQSNVSSSGATFSLVAFKDAPSLIGTTMSPAQFQGWLDELVASGGGECQDAALNGLLAMARQMPNGDQPAGDILLATDATPDGGRAQYVYTVDRMLRRGVRVTTLLNDWCPGAPIGPAAMGFLSLASGGKAYPTDATYYLTDTLIALNSIATADTVLDLIGDVSVGQPDIYPILVDGSMTTLGVEDDYYN